MATATLAPSAAPAAEMVPTLTDLAEVYESLAGMEERYQSLASAFEKQFGGLPDVLARAPGRVNLIGEHIDYSGYGVLPMAIVQDTVVAIKKGGTCLDVASVVPEEYPRKTFDTSAAQEVDTANHSWANYFLCGYKGVSELLEGLGQQHLEPTGLQVLVQGNVPTGAGVSSSAALICASMLAILAAHGRAEGVKKADVAMAAARAERYVGVSSGGMDQAISMMGMKGLAKKVEFNPVRTEDVALPEGAAFVIGHSLAVSNKAVGAERRFNMRVVECRLAAMVLAAAMGHPKATLASDIHTLVDVETVVASSGGLAAVAEAARARMHDGLYTIEEIEGALGAPLEKVFEGSAVSLKVLGVGREDGGFRLRDRALHVFDEAQRVRDFKAVCDSDEPADVKLSKLGALMNASHDSCATLYDCTCPELEQLTTAGRAAGAFGARLTGAGWGGCAVFLVTENAVGSFLAALTEAYYTPEKTQGRDMRSVLFASRPSAGAAVLKLKGVTA